MFQKCCFKNFFFPSWNQHFFLNIKVFWSHCKKNVITFAEWYWLMRTLLSRATEEWSLKRNKAKLVSQVRIKQGGRKKKCCRRWQTRAAVSWKPDTFWSRAAWFGSGVRGGARKVDRERNNWKRLTREWTEKEGRVCGEGRRDNCIRKKGGWRGRKWLEERGLISNGGKERGRKEKVGEEASLTACCSIHTDTLHCVDTQARRV